MFRSRAVICRVLSLGLEQLETRCTPALTWTVAFEDSGAAHSTYYDQIRATLLAAGADWSRYFPSANASIQIAVRFHKVDDGLATGGSETSTFLQRNGSLEVWEESAASEIRTGHDPNGSTRDAVITLDTDSLVADSWFDPTPWNREDDYVPGDKIDAYSIFLHEIGHILGFDGWRDWTTGKLPGVVESRFDRFVSVDSEGTAFFDGSHAMAMYGSQPVPL